MKQIVFVFLAFFLSNSLFAQSNEKGLKLSLQTDLIAYTTAGGWSIWGVAQHHQNKISLAYVNFPNRYQETYDDTGIEELDRFARIQLARYFKSTSKLRNLFYGVNVEYHWRELEEDNNPDEILNDTNWKLGPFIGFEWHPFSKKENAFNNLSIIPWIGLNFRPQNTDQDRVFENTGNVYPIPAPIEGALGLNVSYTFYKNYKTN